ncbi:MAG: hypothetical protein ABFD91_16480 [Anaerohalosphaeraceae bacterium]
MNESSNESAARPENSPAQGESSFLGTFVSMFWLLWGNILLGAMAIKIIQKQALLSAFDIVYWVLVMLMAISRFWDIKYCKGITIKGSRATMWHWRRYIFYLFVVAVGLWLLVNGFSVLKK